MTKKRTRENELINQIVDGIDDIKGDDIQVLDLTAIDNTPCEYFIICTGNSNTHVTAIVNGIKRKVSKGLLEKPFHIEGMEVAEWVLLDYVNVVVHVFQKHIRAYYNIEELWGDATIRLQTQSQIS